MLGRALRHVNEDVVWNRGVNGQSILEEAEAMFQALGYGGGKGDQAGAAK